MDDLYDVAIIGGGPGVREGVLAVDGQALHQRKGGGKTNG